MEDKVKHLEFVQGVVNRLSTNSFLLKGWSVVLVSALFALSAADSSVAFVYLAYVPAVVFWGLDGYFLSMERRYRALYDKVRVADTVDFSMDISAIEPGAAHWIKAVMSKTLVAFHGALLGAVALVMYMQK